MARKKGKRGKVVTMVKKEEKPQFSKGIMRSAEALDAKIREQVEKIGKGHMHLTKLLVELRDKKYHLALGYANFGEYVKEVLNVSAAKAFAQIAVYRELVQGEGTKVSEEDLNSMTMQNAEALVTIKKANPKALTAKVIEAAKTLPERRFQTEVVFPATKSEAGQPEPEIMARLGPFMVSKAVADNFTKALEIGRFVARDDDRTIPLAEKALDAVAAEFIATYGPEYEEHLRLEQERETAQLENEDAGEAEPAQAAS